MKPRLQRRSCSSLHVYTPIQTVLQGLSTAWFRHPLHIACTPESAAASHPAPWPSPARSRLRQIELEPSHAFEARADLLSRRLPSSSAPSRAATAGAFLPATTLGQAAARTATSSASSDPFSQSGPARKHAVARRSLFWPPPLPWPSQHHPHLEIDGASTTSQRALRRSFRRHRPRFPRAAITSVAPDVWSSALFSPGKSP